MFGFSSVVIVGWLCGVCWYCCLSVACLGVVLWCCFLCLLFALLVVMSMDLGLCLCYCSLLEFLFYCGVWVVVFLVCLRVVCG